MALPLKEDIPQLVLLASQPVQQRAMFWREKERKSVVIFIKSTERAQK